MVRQVLANEWIPAFAGMTPLFYCIDTEEGHGSSKKNTERLKPLRKQGPITHRLLLVLHSGDGFLPKFTLVQARAGTTVLY
ncbi:MAG: hypothetical protein EBZ69_08770 [Alphaproteobacteria bacterium]|nr:hypothetical protein [Alphaproteobacteria bacterium]NDC56878.1 hypothetical protein [Alphaproteobacteria bacterium]NDG04683.1 hypothetical protein [Alphaproteobacteria bacterium]